LISPRIKIAGAVLPRDSALDIRATKDPIGKGWIWGVD
jgi:hypothetical protein